MAFGASPEGASSDNLVLEECEKKSSNNVACDDQRQGISRERDSRVWGLRREENEGGFTLFCEL